VFGKVGFESLCKFTPREHHAPPAALAFEADIRAETCDGPLIRTARVLFSEAEMIVYAQVGEHGFAGCQYSVSQINIIN